jgi:Cu2+-exporting ATPase
LTLRPEIAALSMSGSSVIVAVNAILLKRLPITDHADAGPTVPSMHGTT